MPRNVAATNSRWYSETQITSGCRRSRSGAAALNQRERDDPGSMRSCTHRCVRARGKSCATRASARGSRSTITSATSATAAGGRYLPPAAVARSEEHTSELQSRVDLVCRLLLEKKKKKYINKKEHELT